MTSQPPPQPFSSPPSSHSSHSAAHLDSNRYSRSEENDNMATGPASPRPAGQGEPFGYQSQSSLPRYDSQHNLRYSSIAVGDTKPQPQQDASSSPIPASSFRSDLAPAGASANYAYPNAPFARSGRADSYSPPPSFGPSPRHSALFQGPGNVNNGQMAHPLSHMHNSDSYAPSMATNSIDGDTDAGLLRNKHGGFDSNAPSVEGLSSSAAHRPSSLPGRQSRRWPEFTAATDGGIEGDAVAAGMGPNGADPRSATKDGRLGYLDGLKFLAAMLVLNGTFFDVLTPGPSGPLDKRTGTTNGPSWIDGNSPLYILRNTHLGVSLLFLLSGRALAAPFLQPVNPRARTTSLFHAVLSRAMLVRPFRFILPVLVIAGLQWGLAAAGHTGSSSAAGLLPPAWDQIRNEKGYFTLVVNLFTYYFDDTLAGWTFGANLWPMPWAFTGSYAVYITLIMLGQRSSNRYWVLFALAVFSWASLSYLFPFFVGLWIADLSVHGHLQALRERTRRATVLSILLVVIALVVQLVPVIRKGLNTGFAAWNVRGYHEMAFSDQIFAICVLLAVELSYPIQLVLGNIVMRSLGKITAGLFLLPPAYLYTVVPSVATSLQSNSGDGQSTLLGVGWIVCLACVVPTAIAFHIVVELPSMWLGNHIVDALEADNFPMSLWGPKGGPSKNRDGYVRGAGSPVSRRSGPSPVGGYQLTSGGDEKTGRRWAFGRK